MIYFHSQLLFDIRIDNENKLGVTMREQAWKSKVWKEEMKINIPEDELVDSEEWMLWAAEEYVKYVEVDTPTRS